MMIIHESWTSFQIHGLILGITNPCEVEPDRSKNLCNTVNIDLSTMTNPREVLLQYSEINWRL